MRKDTKPELVQKVGITAREIDMSSSLIDLLIEKGIITEDEYEKRIKEKVKV